jgi:hypothetical protein
VVIQRVVHLVATRVRRNECGRRPEPGLPEVVRIVGASAGVGQLRGRDVVEEATPFVVGEQK